MMRVSKLNDFKIRIINAHIINQLADALGTTPSYLLGYAVDVAPIRSLADVMGFLFRLEEVSGIEFDIDVNGLPAARNGNAVSRSMERQTRISTRTCVCFLRIGRTSARKCEATRLQGKPIRNGRIRPWPTYSASAVECVEPEDISEEERIEKRNAYLNDHYDGGED